MLTIDERDGKAMKREDVHIGTPRRRVGMIRSLIALIALVGATAAAWGQGFPTGTVASTGNSPSLQVSALQSMRFPCLNRNESHTIRYTDWSAGQFEVRGAAGRTVRIRLRIDNPMVNSNPNSGPDQLNVGIGGRDVAMSRDQGVTWTPINDADLDFTARLPHNGIGGVSSILVRIGLRLSADQEQQRGDYCGRIRLTACYVN